METFEKCKAIRSAILRSVGEVMAYESWDNEFKLKNIQEIPNIVSNWQDKHGSFEIDPNDMTAQELKELGFSKWDDESELMLIPIWLYPYLADEIKTTSISDEEHTKKSEIDTDHRFGNLAYGVKPIK